MQRKAVQPNAVTAPAPGNWFKELTHRFYAVFEGDVLLNSSIVVAILIGFFHGWLKLKFRSPITTFAVDIFLGIALLTILLRKSAAENLFPPGKVSEALKGFFVLCAIYSIPSIFLPGMPPILLASVSIRWWTFSSLMFLVGYHLIRSTAQLRGYYYLIIAAGLVTAIYGIRQTPEDVQAIIDANPDLAMMLEGQRYVDDSGEGHLRRFSTFISSGAFGGTMASVLVLSAALFTDPKASKLNRATLLLVSLPIAYGLVLSGARSSVLSLGFGLAVIFWIRRSVGIIVVGAILLGGGILLGSLASGGGALDRLNSLRDSNTIIYRYWIPTKIGLEYLSGHLLGGGLGKSGHLPAFIGRYTGYSDFVRSDGDLGRLMIELGIPGLIMFGYLTWVVTKEVIRIAKVNSHGTEGSLAMGSAANFFICLLTFPIGSPFVSVPMGLLVWFIIGANQRIAEAASSPPTQVAPAASSVHRRRRPSFPVRPAPALADVAAPTAPTAAAAKRPQKRFLYYKPPVNPTP